MKKEIANYNFKEGLPIEFEIVDLKDLYKTTKEKLTESHRLDFYQIVWFKNGDYTHQVDFQSIDIEPNTILFLNKGMVQQFNANEHLEGTMFLFTDNFFCKSKMDANYLQQSILFNDLYSQPFIRITDSLPLFNTYLSMLIAECKNQKDEYQTDIIKNLFYNFLLISERERKNQGFIEIEKSTDLEYVLSFKNVLENNFYSTKTVSFYSEHLNITPKRLNKATTKILAKSPKEIIDYRVVLEAKRLISHTKDSIKEIGFMLGFDEPTNFVKYFKKHNNVTPLEFREQLVNV